MYSLEPCVSICRLYFRQITELPGVAEATLNNFVSARRRKSFLHRSFRFFRMSGAGLLIVILGGFIALVLVLEQARSEGLLERLPQLLSKALPCDDRAQSFVSCQITWELLYWTALVLALGSGVR